MANVRTFTLPHYPDHPVHVAAFKDIKNAAFLRSQLMEANPQFDYAFLDATMILSPNHLLSACFLALHNHLTARLKARTPHSELVFRLHPNNNIGESYKKFGIADDTTCLIAVKLGLSPGLTNETVARHLGEQVQGESVYIGENGEELAMWADVSKIRKVYKLDAGGAGGAKGGKNGTANGNIGSRDERADTESIILGTMTVKGS